MKEPVCTLSSLAAAEPLIGSAPRAPAWVCLEQPGPWGPKAFTASRLDPELGAAIEAAAAAVGVRPSLIRRPGRHPDLESAHRTVLVAHTDPDAPWLLAGATTDPADVLALDWAAVASGDLAAVAASAPFLEPTAAEQLLVCTNGTRDTCCARLGRPVAEATAADEPGRVWEATHTSGHRLAPTSVLLPSGYLHGRLTSSAGTSLLRSADRGELVLEGLRGRSTWDPAGQAAEEVVRRAEQITGLHDLSVAEVDGCHRVSHRDGRTWTVAVTTETSGERAESCGKAVKPVVRYLATVRA